MGEDRFGGVFVFRRVADKDLMSHETPLASVPSPAFFPGEGRTRLSGKYLIISELEWMVATLTPMEVDAIAPRPARQDTDPWKLCSMISL